MSISVLGANRETISKQMASFIYLEELKTFMFSAILDLMLKSIFSFSLVL